MVLRFFVLPVFLLSLFPSQVEAAIYRYSFDIVSSNFWFEDFFKWDSEVEPGFVPIESEEYGDYIRKYHPLGHAYDKTGRIVFDAKGARHGELTSSYDESESPISCVSGFLCLADLLGTVSILDGFGFPGVLSITTSSNFPFRLTLLYPNAGNFQTVSMSGYDKNVYTSVDNSCATPEYPNCIIDIYGAEATFNLGNFSRVRIDAAPTPVPLPTSAWLLGLGVFAIGLTWRRRPYAA